MYAIRLSNEPVWFCNGKEETFDTVELAVQALRDEIAMCEEAVAKGYMEDCNFEDYRIERVA